MHQCNASNDPAEDFWFKEETHREGVKKYVVYVVVNSLSQVIFVFLLFLGMVMYANEIETKEK